MGCAFSRILSNACSQKLASGQRLMTNSSSVTLSAGGAGAPSPAAAAAALAVPPLAASAGSGAPDAADAAGAASAGPALRGADARGGATPAPLAPLRGHCVSTNTSVASATPDQRRPGRFMRPARPPPCPLRGLGGPKRRIAAAARPGPVAPARGPRRQSEAPRALVRPAGVPWRPGARGRAAGRAGGGWGGADHRLRSRVWVWRCARVGRRQGQDQGSALRAHGGRTAGAAHPALLHGARGARARAPRMATHGLLPPARARCPAKSHCVRPAGAPRYLHGRGDGEAAGPGAGLQAARRARAPLAGRGAGRVGAWSGGDGACCGARQVAAPRPPIHGRGWDRTAAGGAGGRAAAVGWGFAAPHAAGWGLHIRWGGAGGEGLLAA
jgi:hypothetical protein